MIKNIIYVEDGSVDVDELQLSLGEDTKIIVYRQGATKPVIEQLATPIGDSSTISPVTEEFKIELQRAVEEARQKTAEEILNYIGELDDDGIPMKHYAWHETLRKKYGVKKGENMKRISI